MQDLKQRKEIIEITTKRLTEICNYIPRWKFTKRSDFLYKKAQPLLSTSLFELQRT
jgi:hypothetical protein